MENFYDVVIIGSGPAGLFSALELSEFSGLKTAIIEKEHYSSGGLKNDGKLNLTPKIGMDLGELKICEEEADKHINTIDDLFVQFGADGTLYGLDQETIKRLEKRAERCHLELISCKQRHIGTDHSRLVINNFLDYLKSRKVNFLLRTNVEEIKKDGEFFEISLHDRKLKSRFVIAAPGRKGAYWLRNLANKLEIKYTYGPIDLGTRLEMPYDIYRDITDKIYDPKIRFVRSNGDIVRTFCTNPGGSVVIEHLPDDLKVINGHAYRDRKTDKTNLAILITRELKDPYEDTTELGRDTISRTLRIGGGKPIIQRMGDFLHEVRSKSESFSRFDFTPSLSLSVVCPADMRIAYSGREMNGICEMIDRLEQFVPGIKSSENILYAPEVKFYDTKYETTKGLETTLKNFFVAGDGAGKSRGIIGAAISGILAGKGVLNKL